MTERRYIVGSTTDRCYAIRSTRRAPVVSSEGHARFPTHDDGSGRECSTGFAVVRGVLNTNDTTWVARETDDPDLIAKIDAAAAMVERANDALRAAREEEREILRLLAPRCKPARLR